MNRGEMMGYIILVFMVLGLIVGAVWLMAPGLFTKSDRSDDQ